LAGSRFGDETICLFVDSPRPNGESIIRSHPSRFLIMPQMHQHFQSTRACSLNTQPITGVCILHNPFQFARTPALTSTAPHDMLIINNNF
jgi:hypothetical protein